MLDIGVEYDLDRFIEGISLEGLDGRAGADPDPGAVQHKRTVPVRDEGCSRASENHPAIPLRRLARVRLLLTAHSVLHPSFREQRRGMEMHYLPRISLVYPHHRRPP